MIFLLSKGDKCWIIENGHIVVMARILSLNGNLVLLKLETGKSIRVPKHRLHKTKEEAEEKLPEPEFRVSKRTPYDYM